jgi:hypothetical protein
MFMERGFGLDGRRKAGAPYFPVPHPVKASSGKFPEMGESSAAIMLIGVGTPNVNRITLIRITEENAVRAGER